MFDMPPVEFPKVVLEEDTYGDEICLLNALISGHDFITFGYYGNVYQVKYTKTEKVFDEMFNSWAGIPITECETWKADILCAKFGTEERVILSAQISNFIEDYALKRMIEALKRYVLSEYFEKHPETYYK